VRTYFQRSLVRCGSGITYATGRSDYEIYNSTTDLGTYSEYINGNCADGQDPVQWSPDDPAVVYSDPNLP
jgi:hypothetical protein